MKKTDGIAIAKMDELRQKIVDKLQGKSPKVDEALVKAKQGDPTTLDTITIGLENFEAGELEAEIRQQTKTDSTANIEQTGATGGKYSEGSGESYN